MCIYYICIYQIVAILSMQRMKQMYLFTVHYNIFHNDINNNKIIVLKN